MSTDTEDIAELVSAARRAQVEFERWDQARVDDAVTAVAWSAMQEDNARTLARLAAEQSGLGNAEDKYTKIKRKTKGTLMDLLGAPSVGVIDHDVVRGVTTIAKPMGVIAALLPSTNPAATAVNNIMIMLKGANAVILAPHPRGEATCAEAVRLARAQLQRLGAPADLVQYLSLTAGTKAAGKARASALMAACDYSLVTGGPANVDLAYRSGTPAHGVGVGNAPVIIDATADLDATIPKIVASKTFDHATSCSSENALLVESSIYDDVLARLRQAGGYVVQAEEKTQLQAAMWTDGHLNRSIVAQPAAVLAEAAGLTDPQAHQAQFLVVEESGIGADHPFSGEKMSVVLAVYKWDTFDEALKKVNDILTYMGLGHSCGIHTGDERRAMQLAESAKVSTVLVNQPHSSNNGGAFDNGLAFTLSMGAGTWGKNDSCENLTYKHFLNFTYLARPISTRERSETELFADFLSRFG